MSPTTVKFDRITAHDIHESMLFIDASRISILATAQLFYGGGVWNGFFRIMSISLLITGANSV